MPRVAAFLDFFGSHSSALRYPQWETWVRGGPARWEFVPSSLNLECARHSPWQLALCQVGRCLLVSRCLPGLGDSAAEV